MLRAYAVWCYGSLRWSANALVSSALDRLYWCATTSGAWSWQISDKTAEASGFGAFEPFFEISDVGFRPRPVPPSAALPPVCALGCLRDLPPFFESAWPFSALKVPLLRVLSGSCGGSPSEPWPVFLFAFLLTIRYMIGLACVYRCSSLCWMQ